MKTSEQPETLQARAVMIPIVPAPKTRAESPGLTAALVTACNPMARGSMRAPSAIDTPSGSLKVNLAGWTTLVLSTPWIGGVAQKRTEGSML